MNSQTVHHQRKAPRGSARRRPRWEWLLLFPLLLSAPIRAADSAPRAEALLKGVENRLGEYPSFTAAFEVEDRKLPKPLGIYTVKADYDNGKILFLVEYPQRDNKKAAFLFRDETVTIFDDADEYEVKVVDLQTALGQISPIVFDPRTIGLSDLQSLAASITACLSLDGRADEYRVETVSEGDSGQNSYAVTVVSSSPIGKVEKTYQIQEPSFRVEKVRFRTEKGDLTIEVDNQYDDKISPVLPSVSTMLRTDSGTVDVDKTIKVTGFQKKLFRDDHFSEKSMNIKHNAQFTSYGLAQASGYWDAENGTIIGRLSAPPQPKSKRPWKMDRYFWIKTVCWTGSLVILVILILRAKRWWNKNGLKVIN